MQRARSVERMRESATLPIWSVIRGVKNELTFSECNECAAAAAVAAR